MTADRLRVLHVIGLTDPAYGGPAIAALELCKALADRDVLTTLATTDRTTSRTPPSGHLVVPRGFETHTFPCMRPRSYNTSPRLARFLMQEVAKADVVHIHSIYGFHTLAAATAALRAGIPFVVEPHGALTRYHHRQKRRKKVLHERLADFPIVRRAAAVRCASEAERSDLRFRGLGDRAVVIPHGVELPPQSKRDRSSRNAARPPRVPPTALFMARIHEKKRLNLTIQAFQYALGAAPDARLRVVGEGNPDVLNSARTLADDLGIGSQVDFAGGIYGAERWVEFEKATAYVLLSDNESFGMTALEAAAAGVPVLATRHVPSAVQISKFGAVRLVEGTVDEAGGALAAMLTDSSLGDRAQRAAALICEQYSWPAIAGAMEELYRRVNAAT